MKEYIDPLIEEKCRRRDELAKFIAAIEKLPSPKYRKLAIYQGNYFINVYKTLFEKHYEFWLEEILTLSIEVTPDNTPTSPRWYIGITDPDET